LCKDVVLWTHLQVLRSYGFYDLRFKRYFSRDFQDLFVWVKPSHVYGPRRLGVCVCDVCCAVKGYTRVIRGKPRDKLLPEERFSPVYVQTLRDSLGGYPQMSVKQFFF